MGAPFMISEYQKELMKMSCAHKDGWRIYFYWVLTKVDGECAPLDGRGVEVSVLHVEVPRGDCLRAQAIEQRHLCSARDAH
jgi:hypothetical protein